MRSGSKGCKQPHSLPRVENEAERIRHRHGGREGVPVAMNPTVLLVPELPLFLWQVLLVNLALGLKGLTETDSLAAWSVCTLPEVREA